MAKGRSVRNALQGVELVRGPARRGEASVRQRVVIAGVWSGRVGRGISAARASE